MPKHRTDLTKGLPLPSTWVNSLMEFVGTQASPNFRLEKATATTVRVAAGADDDQVAVAIDGKWRFNSATATASHPGGAAGTFDVFVTSGANDFSLADPADATNYSFGLAILAQGSTPGTVHSRKVGTVIWDGAAITAVRPLIGNALQDDLITTDSGLTATRQAGGGWLLDVQDGGVTSAHLANALKPSQGAAAGTEALRALGATASTAAAGDDSRLSDARTPTGPAGGKLSGTYPNPGLSFVPVKRASGAEITVYGPFNIKPSITGSGTTDVNVGSGVVTEAEEAGGVPWMLLGSIVWNDAATGEGPDNDKLHWTYQRINADTVRIHTYRSGATAAAYYTLRFVVVRFV